eukprot:TRINITY_DN17459_c0_g1_i1.p1 TRINITY_DN17459_c0_g1~~TRINITY_DN17459_c0_g1_i1.p1  ORF type:complete len:515 (-),score=63.27 TRINITY_DN17459_c0_g1_i1:284-1828(-)
MLNRITRARSRRQPQVTRALTAQLFQSASSAPAIGGLSLELPLSEHLLPAEVVLFEPSPGEVHRGGKPGNRLIVLNTQLTEFEQNQLENLHTALANETQITEQGVSILPLYVRLHALRILQQAKWNVDKALKVIQSHLEMRVNRLPIDESSVIQDLKSGMMYWHGRDRACRPLLIWRIGMIPNYGVDQATRLILFILEFAVRYLLVPGRVESWVLIVDLTGVGLSTASSHARSMLGNITRLLEEVYCGRNFCTKIFHMPWVVRAIVNSLIPEDKKSKVEFVADRDIAAVMRGLFEPHQLEEQYGGTAPNVKNGEAYPYRFFANCTGKSSGESGERSLHGLVDRSFHEGHSWDLYPAERATWEGEVCQQSLTRASATALRALLGVTAEPCTSLEQWKAMRLPISPPRSQDELIRSPTADVAITSDEPAEMIPIGFPDSSDPQVADAKVGLATLGFKLDPATANAGLGSAVVEACDEIDDPVVISNTADVETMDNTTAPAETFCGIWSCRNRAHFV